MRKEKKDKLVKATSQAEWTYNHIEKVMKAGLSFKYQEHSPLCDSIASGTYLRSDGIKVLVCFFWIETKGGEWRYYMVTEAHVHGMRKFADLLYGFEKYNYTIDSMEV